MGSFQQIAVAAEAMNVLAHRALLAVEGFWMGNCDVVIVERVVMRDFPIASQAALDLSKLDGCC
jgi:hypothetical protein